MYACICHAVTDAEVGAAVATGANSVRAIRESTGAGSNCGSCVKRLSCLLSAYKQDAPDPQANAPVAPHPRPAPIPAQPQVQPQPQPSRLDHLLGCPAAAPAMG